jgi:hypothetical protein
MHLHTRGTHPVGVTRLGRLRGEQDDSEHNGGDDQGGVGSPDCAPEGLHGDDPSTQPHAEWWWELQVADDTV